MCSAPKDEDKPTGLGGALDVIDSFAPEGWKAKLGMATAQLLAGTQWGAEYYSRVREVKDISDGRSKVNAMVAEAVGQQAIADPELMERAKARFFGSLIQKQENVEIVISESAKLLEHHPDPDLQAGPYQGTSPLDQDWATAFTREAECASSDELRSRLAKILAGEIVRPGTYPRSALRMVAELDKEALANFKLLLSRRVKDIVVVGDDWPERERLGPLLQAESDGLVVNSSQPLRRELTVRKNNTGFIFGNDHILTISLSDNTELFISIVRLTREGQIIADLLSESDETEVLRYAFEQLQKDKIISAHICPYSEKSIDGTYRWTMGTQLWPAQPNRDFNPFGESPITA